MKVNSKYGYGSIQVGSSNDNSLIDYNNNDDGISTALDSQFDEYSHIYSQNGIRSRHNNHIIKKKFNIRRSYTTLSIISIVIFFLMILISQTNIISFLNFKNISTFEFNHLNLFSSTTTSTTTTSPDSISSLSTTATTNTIDPSTNTIKKDSNIASSITINLHTNFKATLARSGYNPLIYFNQAKTSTTSSSYLYKYKFLEGYVGIVEPYADMALVITSSIGGTVLNNNMKERAPGESQASDARGDSDRLKETSNFDDYYYTYTVCSVEKSDDCYTGTKYVTPTIAKTTTTVSPPPTTTTAKVSTDAKTTTTDTKGTRTEEEEEDDDDDEVTINVPCTPFTDYTLIVNKIIIHTVSSSSSSLSSSTTDFSTNKGTITSNISKTAVTNSRSMIDEKDSERANTTTIFTGLLKCMYVRREIRSLTESDRIKTMNAMSELWTVGDEESAAKYGSQYRSAHYLVKFHYFNAAWQEGDHIHEGNGFLPQHLKMTNIFEESMQTVDKSVALPYWDSTIEMAQGLSVFESPIFTAEMFGSLPRPKDSYWGWSYTNDSIADGRIPDGRWANIQATMNTEYEDLDFGYGYLRAPWNMNPSSYISRFTSTNKEFPTCSAHYDMLNYTLLKDFLRQAPYDAHASTHGVTGGLFGCDLMNDLRLAGYINDEESQINICKNFAFYIKEMYRDNLIIPMKNCTLNPVPMDNTNDSRRTMENTNDKDILLSSRTTNNSTMKKNLLETTSSSSSSILTTTTTTDSFNNNTDIAIQNCGFTCTESAEFSTLSFFLKQVLNSDYETVPRNMPDEGWEMWVEFICSGLGYKIFAGDHLESASPADPSFWPIHPTLERLLQVKYMTGGFESDEWPTDAQKDYICDKSSCYNSTTNSFDTYDYCCYGHYQHDQLLDATSGSKYSYFGLTNQEMMDGTNPTLSTYSMTYVYDSFDWSHCAQAYGEELNFDTLIQGLSSRMSTLREEKGMDSVTDSSHPVAATTTTTAATTAAGTTMKSTATTTTTTTTTSLTNVGLNGLVANKSPSTTTTTVTTYPTLQVLHSQQQHKSKPKKKGVDDVSKQKEDEEPEQQEEDSTPPVSYQQQHESQSAHQSFHYGTTRQTIIDTISRIKDEGLI